jgi:hypothetical protein
MLENTGTLSKEVASDKNRETKSEIWFSHIEDIWNAELKGTQKVFYWTDESQMWDWDNCTISWLPKDRNASSAVIRIVIRSLRTVFSEYRKKNVKLRYMCGFDVEGNKIHSPKEEKYKEPLDNKPRDTVKRGCGRGLCVFFFHLIRCLLFLYFLYKSH